GLVSATTENKWSPWFIIRDPHYGIPINVLLPRKVREFLVLRVFKLDNKLEDWHWFGSLGEVSNLFKKHGIDMETFDDLKDREFYKLKCNSYGIFSSLLKKIYKTMIIYGVGKKV
ncbi:hypothetical protein KKE60_08905, partial [Patescibacteria group bacterium]|nr:hypothetical protein [Patescibacteria group bacterium]